MSQRLFSRRPSAKFHAPPHQQEANEVYSSLLLDDDDDADDVPAVSGQHRRPRSSLRWSHGFTTYRLSTEGAGERPPTRKLVKDPNGSGRPSFSLELSDSDTEKDKGLVRRQIARLKELYRRAEKSET
ncbi:hypothetical protein B0T22DRAFT_437864 [Podospora appendiculata]|uniref:Uncharacterized protein n=1 Tax=Podospora appendiculata TaxID=314037 RepID=A0AAE0XJR9_9PEZI|nr:hypothetical protein B0T22DRAFT_437864 [Podospora appendiculata]